MVDGWLKQSEERPAWLVEGHPEASRKTGQANNNFARRCALRDPQGYLHENLTSSGYITKPQFKSAHQLWQTTWSKTPRDQPNTRDQELCWMLLEVVTVLLFGAVSSLSISLLSYVQGLHQL